MRYTSILLFIAATTMVASGSFQDVRLSIKPLQNLFGSSQDVSVLLNITNIGNELMGVLNVFKPLQELMDPIFDVFCNGEKVNYVGAVAKRRAPLLEDFVKLAPGTSFTVPIKLSDVFNMTQACNYIVELRMSARDYLANFGLRKKGQVSMPEDDVVLSSVPVAFFADAHRNQILEVGAAIAEGRAVVPAFTSCTTARQNLLTTALGKAEALATDAVNYLNRGSVTARYTTWYGSSTTISSTLKSKWNNILSAVKTQKITFDCSCNEPGTYAYVYPTQPYNVYLCGAHWSSGTTGTDSQGGTIIHEVAHFGIVAGTGDHAYGQSAAKSLAVSTPSKAMANSDSYQYFCENYPYQA